MSNCLSYIERIDSISKKSSKEIDYIDFLISMVKLNQGLELAALILRNQSVNSLDFYTYFLFASNKTSHVTRQMNEYKGKNKEKSKELAKKIWEQKCGITYLSEYELKISWSRDRLDNLIILGAPNLNPCYFDFTISFTFSGRKSAYIFDNDVLITNFGILMIASVTRLGYVFSFYGGEKFQYESPIETIFDIMDGLYILLMEKFKIYLSSGRIDYFLPLSILTDSKEFQYAFLEDIANDENETGKLINDIVSCSLGLPPIMQKSQVELIEEENTSVNANDNESQIIYNQTSSQEIAQSFAILREQQRQRREDAKERSAQIHNLYYNEQVKQEWRAAKKRREAHSAEQSNNTQNHNASQVLDETFNILSNENDKEEAAQESIFENIAMLKKEKGRQNNIMIGKHYRALFNYCEKTGLQITCVADNGSHFTIRVVNEFKGIASDIITLVRLHGNKKDLTNSQVSENLSKIVDAIKEVM